MFGGLFGGGEEEKEPSPKKADEALATSSGTGEVPETITAPEISQEALPEFAIGDTVHSDSFHKGKSGNVVGIADGKFIVQFCDVESTSHVAPEHLKKGSPTLETPIEDPQPETVFENVGEAPIEPEPTHHIPNAEEPTHTKADEDLLNITAEKKDLLTEEPTHTKADEDLLNITAEKKDLLTEAPLSPPHLVTMPPQVVEPAIMTPEPITAPVLQVPNMTPIPEENTPTAPATPEQSVASTRPTSLEVEPPRREQFLGPSPAIPYNTLQSTLFSGSGNQTSNYAALSTNESNPTQLVANSAVSTETLMTAVTRSKFFVTPTPRVYCGNERQRLRDEFNTQEIMMEMIFTRFDVDKSNYLEKAELRQLLNAHATAHYINIDDAVKFILTVADENQDGCISKEELRHGLQAWHAFNSMPTEVNRAMKNYEISPDGSMMPSTEQLRCLLKDLNGFHNPSEEEIQTVRSAALAVGAMEDRVTTEQMRKALSVWYTNVERKQTSVRARMEFSFNGWANNVAVHTRRLIHQLPSTGVTLGIVSVDDLEDPLTGEDAPKVNTSEVDAYTPFTENKCSETIGAILWLVLFIMPGMYMHHVSEQYPTLHGCEHDLAFLLKWKGYLAIGLGLSGLCYQIVYDGQFRTFCLVSGLVCIVIGLVQEVVGLGYVAFSTPEKCGPYLWNVNALFFVWSLFWGPCLGCICLCFCTGWFYYEDLHAVHEADMKADRERSMSNGGRPQARE